jgi:hypothetical protein
MTQKRLLVSVPQLAEQVGARVMENWFCDFSRRLFAVECHQVTTGKDARSACIRFSR